MQQNFSKKFILHSAEAYSEPYQMSEIELFSKIVNSIHSLTAFAKNSVLVVWECSEYAAIQ